MNIRTSIAALTFALVSAASFAATPASVDASSLQKVAATTTATPAAPVAAKKMHCPKGEHRVDGKCVK